MDFESPDVAKEFPGLYMGDLEVSMKSDGADYDEDQDKSKKKKDKKKDKDKGYAALAGESSHDEDDTKSPGKSKKIKAFKLTSSKKKDKEKDKEKEHKKEVPPLETHHHSHMSSILRTGSIREKRPFDREKKPSEKELRKSAEKEIKASKSQQKSTSSSGSGSGSGGGGYIAAPTAASTSSNQRMSLPSTSSTKVTTVAHPPTERTNSLTKNLTSLNAFLNAPAPHLKKKDKDKESKTDSGKKDKKSKDKEHSKESMPSLVRLKLKRGSKNSLEESQSDSPVAPSHQFPESPDAIAKEIRRYEALLEQSHAQIKASKKVSKKSEEQLWELQRTLTQLKRKLRSVNALSSASSANIVLSNQDRSSVEKSANIGISASNVKLGIAPTTVSSLPSTSTSIAVPKPTSASVMAAGASVSPQSVISPPISETKPQHSQEQCQKLDLTSGAGLATSKIKMGTSDLGRRLSIPTDVVMSSGIQVYRTDTVDLDKKIVDSGKSKSPGETVVERLQVQAQVHRHDIPHSQREILLTPEDVYEREIESFDPPRDIHEPPRNCPSPLAKALQQEQSPAVCAGAIGVKAVITPEDSCEEVVDSEEGSNRLLDSEDEDFVDVGRAFDPNKRIDETPTEGRVMPAFAVEESDDFDPYALPDFQTDEFIALENEALISFNQKLQDEIVNEEEKIAALLEEFNYLTDAGYKNAAMEDLNSLDDDELAELWYARKVENDSLHEKVNKLRALVVAGILDEFRLETRLHYLQEKASQNNVTNPVHV